MAPNQCRQAVSPTSVMVMLSLLTVSLALRTAPAHHGQRELIRAVEVAERDAEAALAVERAAVLAQNNASQLLAAHAHVTLAASGGTGAVSAGMEQQELRALATKASSALRESSRSLDALLQDSATGLHSGGAHDFLRALRLCTGCSDFDRVGESHDGGYVMCTDGLDSGLTGAYSYGIQGFDGWGMDVARRYHVPLFEYDCYDLQAPKPCDGCDVHFIPECILGNQEAIPLGYQKHATLSKHMQNNVQDHVPDASLLWKLDVEGAEWGVLSQERTQTLKKFRHVNLELHHVGENMHKDWALASMRSLLDAGFAVVHLHGNNCCPMVEYQGYTVPDILEVTLVRVPPGAPCAEQQPRHLPEDQRVLPGNPELPNAKLPSQ